MINRGIEELGNQGTTVLKCTHFRPKSNLPHSPKTGAFLGFAEEEERNASVVSSVLV